MKQILILLAALTSSALSANPLSGVTGMQCKLQNGSKVLMIRLPHDELFDINPQQYTLRPGQKIRVGEDDICKDCVYFAAEVTRPDGDARTAQVMFRKDVKTDGSKVEGVLAMSSDVLLMIPGDCAG